MMQNGAATDDEWAWDDMLKFFRALGGVAENLALGDGSRGRGLFARDETNPVLLRVPERLLFPVTDVEFRNERLQLKPHADVGDAERAFFDRYETAFSWGAGGRTESLAFVAAIDRLPTEVREVLKNDFGFHDLLEGDPAERAQKRFLNSRVVRKGEMQFVMPLAELANHDIAGTPYDFQRDLQIQGKTSGEFLVNYGIHDSLSIFHTFGFANRQPGALSLPVKVALTPREIVVHRGTALVEQRGKDWIPQLHTEATKVELSYLMIGHVKFPRLSRGIFTTLMKEAGVPDPNDGFDRILNFNWTKFLRLLAALEPHESETIVTLRKVARYQLEAISHCVGSRELESQAPPKQQEWSMSIE